MTTSEKVLAALQPYNLKQEKPGQYRSNSPFRTESDSHSFTLKLDDDGEHGTYKDHAGGESGSLYDLAKKLNIELPKQPSNGAQPATDTKRAYSGLAEYAQVHGVDVQIFKDALWTDVTREGRKALQFPTANGYRWRFIDGDSKQAYFKSESGYKKCWYGLGSAPPIAKAGNFPLVIVNGEASMIVARHFGVPAIAVTSGEGAIPDGLLKELTDAWQGEIIIALDCDETGRRVAFQIEKQLTDGKAINLGLSDHGDVADFCKLHTTGSMDALLKLPRLHQVVETQQTTDDTKPNPVDLVSSKIVSTREAYAELITSLSIHETIPGEPLPVPMEAFHKFGGYAHVIMPRKMVAIVAPSAGGKTSFIETWVDEWLQRGISGAYWGAEWRPVEYMQRRIQRYTGITLNQFNLYDLYKKEHERGVPENKRIGKPLSKSDISKIVNQVKEMRGWTGTVDYPDISNILLSDMLEGLCKLVYDKRHAGIRFGYVVFDYAQLLNISKDQNIEGNHVESAMHLIKDFANDNDIIPIVGSQMTKSASQANKHDGVTVSADSALFMRDFKFNFMIGLDLTYIEDFRNPGEWIKTGEATASIIKNSTEETGKIPMKTDFPHLTWRTNEPVH